MTKMKKGNKVMKKLIYMSMIILCVGCTSAPSAKDKEWDEFVALAQKFGYCGQLGHRNSDKRDEEYFQMLNAQEATISEKNDGWKLCYEPDKTYGWQNYARYSYIKWANENLAKWNRGFKEQFAYQRQFVPKSFGEFNFGEKYVIGWKKIEDSASDIDDDEDMAIYPADQRSQLGKLESRGEIKLKKPIFGFSKANISLSHDGNIREIEMCRKLTSNSSAEYRTSEGKAVWKLIEDMYRIKATDIDIFRDNGVVVGRPWWCFSNDNCKIDLNLSVIGHEPDLMLRIRVE